MALKVLNNLIYKMALAISGEESLLKFFLGYIPTYALILAVDLTYQTTSDFVYLGLKLLVLLSSAFISVSLWNCAGNSSSKLSAKFAKFLAVILLVTILPYTAWHILILLVNITSTIF